jgi:hypothetical protein
MEPGGGLRRSTAALSAASQELLSDLALELNAVRAVLGHGLPSFESPAPRQSPLARLSAQRDPAPQPPQSRHIFSGHSVGAPRYHSQSAGI